MTRLTACGIALTGLSGVCLGLLAVWSRDGRMDDIMPVMVSVLTVAVAVYFLAVRLVLGPPRPRRALWLVLIVAAALRLPLLSGPPFLSSDIYRYVWDGRVQAAGINPYLFVPADPAVAALRDAAIYPLINRAGYAHTIYPPAAQVLFAAVGRVSQTVLAEKLMLAGFEALAILCGLGLLSLARLPPERILIYAWNPLAVWAFACDGHVDAAAIGLLAAALLLRCRGRDGWAGAAFGAAVLIKFMPLAVGPALWRRGGNWRLAACGAAAMAALYACYLGAGWQVFGFLSGYGAEEGLDSGRGIWLLGWLGTIFPLPPHATAVYIAAAAAVLGAFALRVMTRRSGGEAPESDAIAVCGAATILAAGAMAALSPHYPWYCAWIALPAAVTPYRSAIWLSAAPVLLYLFPFDNYYLWPSLIYVPALALALADLRARPLAPPTSAPHTFAPPSPVKG